MEQETTTPADDRRPPTAIEQEVDRELRKNGFAPHFEDECRECSGYEKDVTAVRRASCACGYADGPTGGGYADDGRAEGLLMGAVPVAFADGYTVDVSEERVGNCQKSLRHDRDFKREWYRHDATTLGAAGIVATELRAAAGEECRQMGEAQRVVRDVSALVQEFRAAHRRLCGCPLCVFWATARPAKRKAALKALKAADDLIAAAQAFTVAVKAAAPDYGAYRLPPECSSAISPFDQPRFFTPQGTADARDRLAASRAYVNAEYVLDDDGNVKVDPAYSARMRARYGFPGPKSPAPPAATEGAEAPSTPPAEGETAPAIPDPIAERMAGLPLTNGHACNGTH